jgi:hypothetical protein
MRTYHPRRRPHIKLSLKYRLRPVRVGTCLESGDENMGAKLAVAVAVLLFSISSLA